MILLILLWRQKDNDYALWCNSFHKEYPKGKNVDICGEEFMSQKNKNLKKTAYAINCLLLTILVHNLRKSVILPI